MDKPKAILKIAVAIKELGNAEKKGIAGVAELRYDWYDPGMYSLLHLPRSNAIEMIPGIGNRNVPKLKIMN